MMQTECISTAKRPAESPRRVSADAETVEALSRLARAAIHDLNNCLTVIVTNATLVRSHAGDAPLAVEHAEAIERSAMRGAQTLARALDEANHLVSTLQRRER